MREQLDRFTHTCMQVTQYEPYVELAERLNALTPGDVRRRRPCSSRPGAEAVENAVKIARYATGRQAVVVFDHAFHGRTLLAMTMTAKAMPYKSGLGPFAPEVYRLPMSYPYRCPTGASPEECGPSCAEEAIAPDGQADRRRTSIACHRDGADPGRGRVRRARRRVPPGPRRVLRGANGIVFVADEVQTGFGRTGEVFAIEHEGVVPDLVDHGEVAGGRPAARRRSPGRAEIMDSVHAGGLGGTFGGNPLACAAALAVLDQIEREDLLGRRRADRACIMRPASRDGRALPLIGDVRGRGAMVAIELVEDRDDEGAGEGRHRRGHRGVLPTGRGRAEGGTYDNVIRLLPR